MTTSLRDAFTEVHLRMTNAAELNEFIVNTYNRIREAKASGNPLSGLQVEIGAHECATQVMEAVSLHFPDLDVEYFDHKGTRIETVDPLVGMYMDAVKRSVDTDAVNNIALVGSSCKSKDFMAEIVVQLHRAYPDSSISIDGFPIDLS